MQASELHLPQADPSLVVSSLLFEPISHSLALVRSDSSLLLYPPFSSFPPPSPTIIPPLSTNSSFLRFHPNPNPNSASRVIFLTARPHAAGSSILLRAWILTASNSFAPICLDFNCKHGASSAAVIGLSHGFSIKIGGSVNFFALYSASARKIWVLSVRLRDDRTCLDLMKCAVIDCTSPIYSLRVSMGLLLLGEVNGVRVFPVRLLVKGRVKKKRNMEGRSENDNLSPNSDDDFRKKQMDTSLKDMGGCCNGGGIELEGTAEISSPVCNGGHRADYSLAIRNIVKLRQDSGDLGSFFVAFKCSEVQSRNGLQTVTASLKAVSIHSLSQQRFLILDSNGVLHLFSMHNTTIDSEVCTRSCVPSRNGCMRRLNYTMKVEMLAVHPDIASRTCTIWISDGCYSVHIMSFTDVDISTDESNNDGSDGKLMQNSAVQSIFTSEKVQDIIPYSANGVLILGQGSIFAYGIA